MVKPKILLQPDLFSEDEFSDTKSIISEYFDITEIDIDKIFSWKRGNCDLNYYKNNYQLRASLEVAKTLGYKFEYANVLNWLPHFREYTLDPHYTKFNDLKYIFEYMDEYDIRNSFIRPVDPFKSFAGQVFASKSKFDEEYVFLTKNKNISPNLLCMISNKVKIDKEYRCIFINNEFVAGTQYMIDGELSMAEGVPKSVQEFAIKLSKDNYFLNSFDFTIDVAESYGKLHLLEINAFQTASFYKADLHKIYQTLANSYYD